MDDLNLKRIDAPWPDQWREGLVETMRVGLEDFMDEIKAIRKLIEVQNVPGVTQADLAKFYTKKEGGSRSEAASLPPNLGEVPPQVTQQQLSAMAQKTGVVPPAPPGSSASTPPDSEAWREGIAETQAELRAHPIALPQHYGGKYTVADIAMLGAQLSNRRLENTEKERKKAEQENDIEAQARAENTERDQAKRVQGWSNVGTKYIPGVQAAVGIGKNYYSGAQEWSKGLSSYATSLGMQPGETEQNNLDIFGMHFRPPWNSAALAGARQTLSDFGTSMNVPGANMGTIMAMRQSIAGRGWQESNGTLSQGGENMMTVMEKLFGRGGVFQELSENPEVLDLLDKATRSGTKGIDEMTKTIESIPDAAEAAHETIGQMVKDMNSYGEMNQKMGGTHAAGQEQALQVAALTGIPAASMQSLFESPYFQSKVLQRTGVPSFMQGTVPTALKAQMAVQTVHEYARMVGNNYSGRTEKSLGGFEGHVSGEEEKIAAIHAYMEQTGIQMNPEQIKKLLNENPHRLQVQGALQKSAQDWRENALAVARKYEAHPHSEKDKWAAEGALTASIAGNQNWGQLLRTMGQQTTVNGKGEVVPMFSKEDIKALRTGEGEGLKSYAGLHGAELAERKYKNVQKIIEEKTRKNADQAGSPTNPAVIELGPQARQFFRFQNKKYRMKLESNAGSGQPINNSATGYTDHPTPGYEPIESSANGGNIYVPEP